MEIHKNKNIFKRVDGYLGLEHAQCARFEEVKAARKMLLCNSLKWLQSSLLG
jgi:hypothetical protein